MNPTFRRTLVERLTEFAWDQWAQMGLSATPRTRSPWAQDPEALMLLTLEVSREEPRLFDELADWALANEALISVRRLRALCVDDTDRALLDGLLGWLHHERPRARLQGRPAGSPPRVPEPLFRGGGPLVRHDEAFAAAGLERPPLRPSGKSRKPDLRAPINLAFRLREILGVGIRAEVVRVLLGSGARPSSAQGLARATAYSKRNVHDALTGLAVAAVISASGVGGEQRYTADLGAWASLLGLGAEELPGHRDWPQIFGALRRILRFSEQTTDLSPYMLASRTSDLLDTIRPDLVFAGIATGASPTANEADRDLDRAIGSLLGLLGSP